MFIWNQLPVSVRPALSRIISDKVRNATSFGGSWISPVSYHLLGNEDRSASCGQLQGHRDPITIQTQSASRSVSTGKPPKDSSGGFRIRDLHRARRAHAATLMN